MKPGRWRGGAVSALSAWFQGNLYYTADSELIKSLVLRVLALGIYKCVVWKPCYVRRIRVPFSMLCVLYILPAVSTINAAVKQCTPAAAMGTFRTWYLVCALRQHLGRVKWHTALWQYIATYIHQNLRISCVSCKFEVHRNSVLASTSIADHVASGGTPCTPRLRCRLERRQLLYFADLAYYQIQ